METQGNALLLELQKTAKSQAITELEQELMERQDFKTLQKLQELKKVADAQLNKTREALASPES